MGGGQVSPNQQHVALGSSPKCPQFSQERTFDPTCWNVRQGHSGRSHARIFCGSLSSRCETPIIPMAC